MNSVPTILRFSAGADAAALARKADLCAMVLAEARRLARLGQSGSVLNQLLNRAQELLEDIDEILVVLGRNADAPERAIAAALHRDVESMRADLAARGTRGAPDAATAD